MYRMYGMKRCHGWQRALMVQDVRPFFAPCKNGISHIHVGRMTQTHGWQRSSIVQNVQWVMGSEKVLSSCS